MKPRIRIALVIIFSIMFLHCAEIPTTISSAPISFSSTVSSLGAPISSGKKSCSLTKTKRGLRIAGATLLGVGAASLITGGVLWSIHNTPAGGDCTYSPQPGRPPEARCVWNTHPGGGVAMGLGAAGMVAGGFMLGYSFAPDKATDACMNTP